MKTDRRLRPVYIFSFLVFLGIETYLVLIREELKEFFVPSVIAYAIPLFYIAFKYFQDFEEVEESNKNNLFYALQVEGFTKEVEFEEVHVLNEDNSAFFGVRFRGVDYPVTPQNSSYQVHRSHPGKNIDLYLYNFPNKTQDFVLVHYFKLVPKYGGVRIFVRPNQEERK